MINAINKETSNIVNASPENMLGNSLLLDITWFRINHGGVAMMERPMPLQIANNAFFSCNALQARRKPPTTEQKKGATSKKYRCRGSREKVVLMVMSGFG